DLAGKKRIGMRCSRESNPSLVAEREAKGGTPVQVPRNCVPINFQRSAAGILSDFTGPNTKMEWILPPCAETEVLQGKSLNEALRFSLPRKPRGPHLHRHAAQVAWATAPPRIHEQ